MPRAGDAPPRVLPGFWALKELASVPNQAGISNQPDKLYTPKCNNFQEQTAREFYVFYQAICVLRTKQKSNYYSLYTRE